MVLGQKIPAVVLPAGCTLLLVYKCINVPKKRRDWLPQECPAGGTHQLGSGSQQGRTSTGGLTASPHCEAIQPTSSHRCCALKPTIKSPQLRSCVFVPCS